MNFYPVYLNEIRNERIRSESYQISEILTNDPGKPLRWYADTNDVTRVGLSDETKNKTNVLSLVKINTFDSECKKNSYNGYYNIKKWLASDYDLSITLIDKTYSSEGNVLINCHPPAPTAVRAINTTVRRIVSFDSGYGELIIQMW
jgi:hypothetical protein